MSERLPQMEASAPPDFARPNTLSWGIAVIGLGIAGLVVCYALPPDIWRPVWPFVIVGFGLIFLTAMLVGGRLASVLAIPGVVFVGVGIVIAWMNWARIAPAWAFVLAVAGPSSVSSGLWIMARRSGEPELRWAIPHLFTMGTMAFFLVGAVMEAAAFALAPARSGNLLLPFLLLFAGAFLVVWPKLSWFRRRSAASRGEVEATKEQG